ncbi:hypothetical protein GCM10010435_06090 [Winogradskya consettensis]|uniref:Uncharacterized protein n=1 Tax=Winogradskya consettensis TaxID=113560 RepID=A0A919SV11_9ACTN|nr:hypothetical protein [Actinoplanes consettensis]GIM79395.1 hypothetical protein Aco04nite_65280 [Actinoplanes consettensis]
MSYHIQDVLKSVRDTAPESRTTTDDIIAQAGRIRTRRTAATVLSGAAVFAALAITAVTTLDAPSGGGQAAAQPLPQASSAAFPEPQKSALPVRKVDFTTKLAGYRTGAYRVGPVSRITEGYAVLPVYQDNADQDGIRDGEITVYNKGVYDPALFGGTLGDTTLVIGDQYSTKVAGRPALGQDWTFKSPVQADKQWLRAALAWQYADNSWATFLPNYGKKDISRADVVKVAAGLTTAAKRELKVPYTLSYVPEGWQTVAVDQVSATSSPVVSQVWLHHGPVQDSATRIDEVLPDSLKILVMKGDPKDSDIVGKDGVHCYPELPSCTIIDGGYTIDVGGWNNSLSVDEVRKVAEGIKPLDYADQSTWVPANK